MDPWVILIFLFASSWCYVAATFLLSDWRWNAGRIGQSLALAGLGAAVLLTGRTGMVWMQVLGALFLLTFVVPSYLRRRLRDHVRRGRMARARRAQRLINLLTWTSGHGALDVVDELGNALNTSGMGGAEQAPIREHLARVALAVSRRNFLAARLDILIALRRHEEAIALFDEQVTRGRLRADAALAYTLAVPHAEVGNMGAAVEWLRRAEGMNETPTPFDLRRFLAFLRVYANAGDPQAVAFILQSNPRLTTMLPPAYAAYWQGVALKHAGEPTAAAQAFEAAWSQSSPAETRLRSTLEEGMASAETHPGTDLPDDVRRSLAALLDASSRNAQAPAWAGARRRPSVTLALAGVSVLLWLITASYADGGRALVMYGANVPELVLSGQWWRMVSSMFLHVSMLHLLFNTYACYLFGTFVERTTGRWGLFTTFMLSGLGGSAASAFFGRHIVSAGASGAVFGLLGAAIVIVLRMRGLFTPQARRTYAFNFIFLAAINMAFGLFVPNIDNRAHLGGFIAGVLCGLALIADNGTGARRPAWRVASYISLILLISSFIGMAYNVHTGGYPTRIPPMKQQIGPDGRWRLSVPVFWEREKLKDAQTIFHGPFGLALGIRSAEPPPGSQGEDDTQGRGGRSVFRRSVTKQVTQHGTLAIMLYEVRAGKQHYQLQFECEASDQARFEPLIRQIVKSFEPTRPAPPPKPKPKPGSGPEPT